MPVATGSIGESLWITSIGVHHVDFKVPIPLRREGNSLTVRRPRGMPVITASIGESL